LSLFEKRIINTNIEIPMQNIGNRVILKLENVTKKYGKFIAVNNINLEVKEGETIGLVGPNGAGKTTTIKMIAKLLKPTSGRILILNNEGELQDLHKSKNDIIRRGFLIDVPFFYKEMTAYQNLRYFARSQHYPKDKIDERIDFLLKLFKLYKWKYEKVKTFSKGMRQKLGIIQALLVDPKIIFLDEPQTGLDPKARVEVRKIIRDLQALGKTIFVASHMLHEISEVCDKIALINQGKIIEFGTLDELEKKLKIKEIQFRTLETISNEKADIIIKKLRNILSPYLDKDIHSDSELIEYNPNKQLFKIYYNGESIAKAEILEILVSKFKDDFRVISFSEPDTTQLERIYQEMIVEDNNNTKKEGKNE